MSIRFRKSDNRFVLHTARTTYAFDVPDGHYLRHLYYGKRTTDISVPPMPVVSFAPYVAAQGPSHSPDVMPAEISFFGSGDFRATSLGITGADGTGVCDFFYEGYRIRRGESCPRDLDGLPSARADDKTEALEIFMVDPVTGCRLTLCYTLFPAEDVISRSMKIENNGASPVRIDNCMPLELYIPRMDMDMISFWGHHPMECNYQRHPLHHGIQAVNSRRGATSHHHNPMLFLCDRKADETHGACYGFNFVYSGSFLDEVEVDQRCGTKVLVGLGAENFSYRLEVGETFASPEAIMTYSAAGTDRASNNFHRFVREHILPPYAVEQPHPVVLNTWEACYFDISEQKLLDFAEESAQVGFDMLVMDDGWFGARHHDRAGLGDWVENREKFPHGLGAFARAIREKGIKFGIWVEPEMVNPDSDLYRAHPEWALRVPSREPLESRQQLVLDLSNEAVIEYLMDIFDRTFRDVPIDYFKWDMNRHLCGVGSSALPPERQGEVAFRHIKGTYRLLAYFRERFPDAVIETCSGGGGRYDLGMMCYGMQIWTSDNTDPYARTLIQASSIMGYPAATMSCHVSDPHSSLDSLDYRYKVAVGGMLGYELNILRMSEEIKSVIARQIRDYRTFEHVIRLGEYRCYAFPMKYPYAAYSYSLPDSGEILLTLIEKAGCPAGETKRIRLTADRNATYTDRLSGKTYTGEELSRGLVLSLNGKPDSAQLYYFKKD